MIGGQLFDGSGSGILIEIFGPVHDIKAVELTFLRDSIFDDGVHEEAFALAIQLLLLTVMPQWEEGTKWISEHMASFGTRGDEEAQTVQGNKIVTLYYRVNQNFVLLSVEGTNP